MLITLNNLTRFFRETIQCTMLYILIYCLFHSIHSAQFEIERVLTLAWSGSDSVTILSSEEAFQLSDFEGQAFQLSDFERQAFRWSDFESQGWQQGRTWHWERIDTSFKSRHGILILYGERSFL